MVKTNRTYDLAVRNGGGVVLTDGRNRYKVSDWSPSDRTVYGWHLADDGTQGAYGKVPNTMTRVDA